MRCGERCRHSRRARRRCPSLEPGIGQRGAGGARREAQRRLALEPPERGVADAADPGHVPDGPSAQHRLDAFLDAEPLAKAREAVLLAAQHRAQRVELRAMDICRERALAEIDVEPAAIDAALQAVPVVQLEGALPAAEAPAVVIGRLAADRAATVTGTPPASSRAPSAVSAVPPRRGYSTRHGRAAARRRGAASGTGNATAPRARSRPRCGRRASARSPARGAASGRRRARSRRARSCRARRIAAPRRWRAPPAPWRRGN